MKPNQYLSSGALRQLRQQRKANMNNFDAHELQRRRVEAARNNGPEDDGRDLAPAFGIGNGIALGAALWIVFGLVVYFFWS